LQQESKYQAVKNYVDHPGRNKLRVALNFSVIPRTVDRWIANYRKYGKSAFIHGNTTLEPECKIAANVREKIVSLYRGDIYNGSNFAHFTELLTQYEGIRVSEQSVRNILHAAGIHSPKMWRETRKRLRQEEKKREKLLTRDD
jgi:transposase